MKRMKRLSDVKPVMIARAMKYCIKTTFRHSPFWSLALAVVSAVSALSVLVNVRVLERMIDGLSGGTGNPKVFLAIIFWIVSVLAMNLSLLSGKYINIHINADMEKNFMPTVIDKYAMIEYRHFESKGTQDLFYHVNASSYGDIVAVLNTVLNILSAAITIVEIIYVFSHAVLWLGAVIVVLMAPLLYFDLSAAYIEMRQRWTMTKDIRKRYYFQSLFADENALQEIKVFNSKDYFINESEKLTQSINKDLKRNIGRVAKNKLCIAAILCLFSLLVVGASSLMIAANQMRLGTFVILISSIGVFVSAEQRLASGLSSAVRISENVNILLRLLELDEVGDGDGTTDEAAPENAGRAVNAPENAPASFPENAPEIVRKNEAVIEFERVSFSYPETENVVLNDVSFTVKRGETVSFVGVNGSGKSTIIKLLCGLYKPDGGTIRINGRDVSEISPSQLAKELSVVFQDGQHYMLSLRENVGLGNIAGLDNDGLLKDALAAAGVRDLFQLEKGLDQKLGTLYADAVNLSGGQWQRVIIARAFAKPADVIIFDEPTSSLDPIAECEMYNTIHNSLLKAGRTAILISHRLASCVVSDRIMVLRDGRICECGSHGELMNANGYYAEMFLKQQSWYK